MLELDYNTCAAAVRVSRSVGPARRTRARRGRGRRNNLTLGVHAGVTCPNIHAARARRHSSLRRMRSTSARVKLSQHFSMRSASTSLLERPPSRAMARRSFA